MHAISTTLLKKKRRAPRPSRDSFRPRCIGPSLTPSLKQCEAARVITFPAMTVQRSLALRCQRRLRSIGRLESNAILPWPLPMHPFANSYPAVLVNLTTSRSHRPRTPSGPMLSVLQSYHRMMALLCIRSSSPYPICVAPICWLAVLTLTDLAGWRYGLRALESSSINRGRRAKFQNCKPPRAA